MTKRRIVTTLLVVVLAACSASRIGPTTTVAPMSESSTSTSTSTEEVTFPVTVDSQQGVVTIDHQPRAIVSLSATHTEMLFAVGAGDQVVAVDEFSNYPEEAPTTDLSGFTPNVEAIISYQPDLVVVADDPGDLVASLEAVGIAVLYLSPATGTDDVYQQIEEMGTATGHPDQAADLVGSIRSDLSSATTGLPDLSGVSFYHEVDSTLFAASSHSFVGQLYRGFGMVNIADDADPDGTGFPQLSAEYVVAANPDLIFLADAAFGVSLDTVSERPGWDQITAVRNRRVVSLDPDVASRWGPRIVDFVEAIRGAVDQLDPSS